MNGIDPQLVFTPAEVATLTRLSNLVIPPSEDGTLPGAGEFDVAGYIATAAPDSIAALRDELAELSARAATELSKPISDVTAVEFENLVGQLRGASPRFLSGFAKQTVSLYYQQDAVLEAIGLEARAPYPIGFDVKPGDLSLLDPVRQRGRIYRETNGA